MNNTSRTSVRTLVMLALLVAMSIVFSRVLSISTGFVRFNLGSLPVLLAALLFGPGAGFAVGAVADIVGGVLAGSFPCWSCARAVLHDSRQPAAK